MINNYTPKLMYRAEDKFAPIPPGEAGLPTIVAEPWLEVENGKHDIEGTYFDRDGNLYYTETSRSRLHRVNVETKEDTLVYEDPEGRLMSAAKVHKDGRIFVPSVGPKYDYGYVFHINPDGTDYTKILEGHVYDDMTFDSQGGFYYTHMLGSVADPIGGVYYVHPDHKTITPLLEGLCCPNGVALSKDERVVWITESTAMRLLRVELTPDGGPTDIAAFGVHVPYYFTGGGVCDSCEIDDDDNLYVSLYGQGRVLVFNPQGWPIGQILMPGREQGLHLGTTHSMIQPGTDDIYICACTGPGTGKNSWIFKAKAFAEAYTGGFTFK